MSERKCFGGLHTLDCPHVRMVADAAVATLLPRIEALEASARRLTGHSHFVSRVGGMANKEEHVKW